MKTQSFDLLLSQIANNQLWEGIFSCLIGVITRILDSFPPFSFFGATVALHFFGLTVLLFTCLKSIFLFPLLSSLLFVSFEVLKSCFFCFYNWVDTCLLFGS